jgi:hypothetical protein
MSELASTGQDGSVARLRTIIVVDVATASAATVFMVVVRVAVMTSSYLTLAAALVAVSGLVTAGGLVPLRHGDVRQARSG